MPTLTLKYQNTGSSVQAKLFEVLWFTENKTTKRRKTETMRSRLIDHKISVRRSWLLKISSTAEIMDAAWFRNWWSADDRWFVYPGTSTDIKVTTDDGDCPISYVNEVVYYPRTEFKMLEVAAL